MSCFPNDPRWDYVIGLARNTDDDDDVAIWLEVHSASSTGNIDEVLWKLTWLWSWLTNYVPRMKQLRGKFVWLASGRVNFRSGSPQMLRIAQRGPVFRAQRLDLDHLP